MQLLSIGNSFSQDAQRYLHTVARWSGQDISTVNLCIGGCTLSKHFRNFYQDSREYHLEFNGSDTGFRVSIREALLARDWDAITLQQASIKSVCADSFFPYLSRLAEEIRSLCPKARLLLHETWGYRPNSARLTQHAGYPTHEAMYAAAHAAYTEAAQRIQADGIIPSGRLMSLLTARYGEAVFRDEIHASEQLARPAMALLWTGYLTGTVPALPDDPAFAQTPKQISELAAQVLNEKA